MATNTLNAFSSFLDGLSARTIQGENFPGKKFSVCWKLLLMRRKVILCEKRQEKWQPYFAKIREGFGALLGLKIKPAP